MKKRIFNLSVFIFSLLLTGCSDNTVISKYDDSNYTSTTIVNLAASTGTTNEDEGEYRIPVTITNASSTNPTTASLSMLTNNEIDFTDFSSNEAVFPAGDSQTQEIVLNIAHNDFYEETEVVDLNLNKVSGGNNATAGNNATFKLTIEYIFKTYLAETSVDVEPLIGYKVEDGLAIEKKYFEGVPPISKPYQDDTELQSKMYQHYVSTIPYDYRKWVVEYLYMDGQDNYFAYVLPVVDGLDKFRFALDARMARDENGVFDGNLEFSYTIIHETTHLFTLNDEQFIPSSADNCSSLSFNGGCARNGSYIQEFYDAFWTSDMRDDYANDPNNLYDKYPEEFVTQYAASKPTEDIAETFAVFVLKDYVIDYDNVIPDEAKEKVDWFENYPEMVSLKAQIIANLKSLGSVSGRLKRNNNSSIKMSKLGSHGPRCALIER